MEMAKIEMDVPKEMLPFIEMENTDMKLKRSALLLHLYVNNQTISHCKAAELLGVNKLDLIELYSELGLSYFDFKMEELDGDVEAVRNLRGSL